ncbi:MAG TPA: toll/interleukin-1 receptor domain-containing protein, partial [Vicinamibacterales bacterium]|nr:toll/interleukin-1 receptor domain-containing protein [Vicinamibacterales bacterium]
MRNPRDTIAASGDTIPAWKRVALFTRRPVALAVALCVADAVGSFLERDAALLGGGVVAAPAAVPVAVSCLIILSAATLPGIAILRHGNERGLAFGIIGLVVYYGIAWALFTQGGLVLPLVATTAAWYVSQVLGLGWQFHEDQSVGDLLSHGRRTVFISYRRSLDELTARMLKQELTMRGFDVFLDVDDLGSSSRFDRTLQEQIERRANFVLVLSPGSLDRCRHDDDWLRLEIVHALKTNRRIVPVTRGG